MNGASDDELKKQTAGEDHFCVSSPAVCNVKLIVTSKCYY